MITIQLPKEQQSGDEDPYNSTFVLGYFNGDSNCEMQILRNCNHAWRGRANFIIMLKSINGRKIENAW